MRIVFILPFASLSGGTRVVATYARELVELGHEVWVVSRPRRIKGHALKRFIGERMGFGAKDRAARKSPLLDFLGARHVVLNRTRPVRASDVPDADVVIATWWDTAKGVADLPASKGRKFYLIQDYETFGNLPAKAVADSYHLPLKKLAVSGYIRDCLVYRHAVKDIALLPNAVDTARFNAAPRSKNTPLKVGVLYHQHPRKHLDLAIAALRQARKDLPQLQAVAFGSSAPGGTTLLPDWVEFCLRPEQQDIPGIYTGCDAWLFTSKSEGFGLPLLEAMACRTPVLATAAGAAPDLIDGTNGKILDPTPDAFAAEILALDRMSDAQWQRMSDAAHRTAHAFDWKEATKRLLAILGASDG